MNQLGKKLKEIRSEINQNLYDNFSFDENRMGDAKESICSLVEFLELNFRLIRITAEHKKKS